MRNIQLDHSAHRAMPGTFPLRLLAHDITLAANVGALFRTADALGVEHLHLSGASPTPPDVRLRRAARSAECHVAHSYEADPLVTVAGLKKAGYRIVSLELTSISIDVRTLEATADDRLCLVLGAENSGVCQALLDVSDVTVHIPMRGHNSSMNVASACAIAVFEILRRFTR